ncbi:alpha/beta fold hydrolase [Paenactinomyces guangxiensis]|uniref:Alpha/beta hydrolase n=1 Tax=Paenactinomyces guangxiensis TaxID=1490290 RepID=A0A7W2AA07_9BACL|nr:alpha/beta hydrolase [Paenactinomyces guangxiensis]MBA4495438.1 alpha/beta hydrolase [Paenactinomyces guangxiensis]MBH8592441.1 alpha/beta hydrolase [Paenactinomyces guangxiensis]
MFKNWTPPHEDPMGIKIDGSIAAIEKVNIGGIEQAIMLRGKSTGNPLLLFLHGGPGIAQIGFARHYQKELENHFLVVNWDQRGAGKSYSKKIRKASMNLEQFISDTYELISKLLERFGQKKLFLVGHSWGSVIGAFVAQRYPELIHAYISSGQMVHREQSMMVSYHLLLFTAMKKGKQSALKALRKIGCPPYQSSKDLSAYWKCLARLGGSIRNGSLIKKLSRGFLSSEYTAGDWLRFRRGIRFSLKHLKLALMKVNLFEQVPELQVPAYFFVGRYDYLAPSELQEQYYEYLDAPVKDIIWFENSAHAPHLEEPLPFFINCLRVKEEILTPRPSQKSLLYV